MDIDQSARRKAKDYFNLHDPDFYEIESMRVYKIASGFFHQ